MATTPKCAKPLTCQSCALEHNGWGYAAADGSSSARLVFIAESLGGDEAIMGRPLVGAAGGVHTRVCHRAGITREHTRADNCIRCQPPGNWVEGAPWEHQALTHCRQYLQETLNAVPRDGVVVTYGGTALRSVLGLHGVDGVNVKDWHGTVNRSPDDRYWVVPTFHPSHLQRGAMNLLEVVTNDLRLAYKISTEGFTRRPVQLVVDPPAEWFRRWCHGHVDHVRIDGEFPLSIDTEFPEGIGGQDESEITWGAGSPLLRFNCANDLTTGITVPHREPYITILKEFLAALNDLQAIVYTWNKYADWDHLSRAGYSIDQIICYDMMWAFHYLQSDLPRGLGFVAPFSSDMGPWKHWAKQAGKEGLYAAADGVQTHRVSTWIVNALVQAGMWDLFVRDWHERDYYVLRPSHELGVPVDRARLETFHQTLQHHQIRLLSAIKRAGAEGTLYPKLGYAKRPKGKDGADAQPPKAILGGKRGKRQSEAKQQYTAEGIGLVERQIMAAVRDCRTCEATAVGSRHRCPLPKGRRKAQSDDASLPSPSTRRNPQLVLVRREQTRYFWQRPFNPDSWQQILAYIGAAGHTPGTSRKTRRPTTDKSSLTKLAADTGDVLYQYLLDYRAVQKVDSTYALGTLDRMDSADRIHPETLPIPSTLRDSSRNPNIQNVVADRGGPDGLAAGFRACIVARDGIPPHTSDAEVQSWRDRWTPA